MKDINAGLSAAPRPAPKSCIVAAPGQERQPAAGSGGEAEAEAESGGSRCSRTACSVGLTRFARRTVRARRPCRDRAASGSLLAESFGRKRRHRRARDKPAKLTNTSDIARMRRKCISVAHRSRPKCSAALPSEDPAGAVGITYPASSRHGHESCGHELTTASSRHGYSLLQRVRRARSSRDQHRPVAHELTLAIAEEARNHTDADACFIASVRALASSVQARITGGFEDASVSNQRNPGRS